MMCHLRIQDSPTSWWVACGARVESYEEYTCTFDVDFVTCDACLEQMAAEVEWALRKPNIAGETLDMVSMTYGRRRKPGETDNELRWRLAEALRKT